MYQTGQEQKIVELWQQFFADPSQWWDHRTEKGNPKYPDFRQKRTGLGLWIDKRSNPAWVRLALATMTPGCVPRSPLPWNASLSGYVKSKRGKEALNLFRRMQSEGVEPDSFTYVLILNACACLVALEEGKHAHAQLIQSGFGSDIFVGNSLVHMYGKCGSIFNAWKVFDRMPCRNVISWNSMIAACVKCEEGQKALELFRWMQRERVETDSFTFVAVINACACIAALEEGRYVHAQVTNEGWETHVMVGNTLIDMYAKCGSIDEAWRVFQSMPLPNVISWNAMLAGCVKCDEAQKALELFKQMLLEGQKPCPATFATICTACANSAALEEGRRVHMQVIQSGFQDDDFIGSTLIHMYAKCRCISDAWEVFDAMGSRNIVCWNAMLAAFVKCDEGQKALQLFGRMQTEGVEPDPVTFVAILNACASLSALAEGRRAHTLVILNGYESDLFVGNSLVDMYSKCGSIEDAWRIFTRMPSRNVVSWTAMLGGLAMHGQGKEALGLFREMVQNGVEINDVTFVCILSACSHGGLVEEGLGYFESMSSVFGISPTAEHVACVVDILGRAGRLDEAENLLCERVVMKDKISAWRALLVACRNSGNILDKKLLN